jgi:hypothetical protein
MNTIGLAIDMDNAVNYSNADNFTVMLFRLLLKSDGDNRAKLAKVYPIEVKMVEIYQTRAPYVNALKVDFPMLVRMAIEEVEGTDIGKNESWKE